MSVYDLVREAELLKSSLTQQQDSSPKSSTQVWDCRQRLEDVYRQVILADLEVALDKRVQIDLWNSVFRTQIASLQNTIKHQQVI